MALSRDLTVRLLADTSDLNAGINKASGPMGKLGGTVGKLAGGFVALGAATVAVDFLGDATKAAEEDKKSQALLANQLRATNKATDEQIATVEESIGALSRATGVADDELRPAYAALARSTGDTEEANRQLALAMDIAAGRGVPLETVTKALEKANNGNTAALGKLGIATKDVEGNQLSLNEVMTSAAGVYAGAAEAAVTPSQRMSVAFNEMKEQVGSALLPVMEKFSTFMAEELLPAIQDVVVWVQAHWPEIQKTIKTTVDFIQPILEGLFKYLKIQFDIISGIIEVFVNLLHGDFAGAWQAIKDTVDKVMEGVKGIVKNAIDFVTNTFGGLIDYIGELPGKIGSAASGMWDGLLKAFKSTFNRIIDLWNSIDFTFEGYDIPGPGPNIPGFTFGLPDMPHLAKGGTIARTGLAVVHQGETVVPKGGGTVFNIQNVNVNANSAEQMIASLNDYARRNGGLRVPGGVTAVS